MSAGEEYVRLQKILSKRLQVADSTMIEALQRLLFTEGLDVRRSDITAFFTSLFAPTRLPLAERSDPVETGVKFLPPESKHDEKAATDFTLEIVHALRTLGAPRHFDIITARLNEQERKAPVRPTTTRTMLGDHPDIFANLGRGVYGLKEWGLSGQQPPPRGEAIADIIERMLDSRDKPMPLKEIVENVTKQKPCRNNSIRTCLVTDDRFHKFGPASYGLKRWVL